MVDLYYLYLELVFLRVIRSIFSIDWGQWSLLLSSGGYKYEGIKLSRRWFPMKLIYFFHSYSRWRYMSSHLAPSRNIQLGVFTRVILRVKMYNWREHEHGYTLLANPKGGENPACPCFSPAFDCVSPVSLSKRFPTTDISLTTKE